MLLEMPSINNRDPGTSIKMTVFEENVRSGGLIITPGGSSEVDDSDEVPSDLPGIMPEIRFQEGRESNMSSNTRTPSAKLSRKNSRDSDNKDYQMASNRPVTAMPKIGNRGSLKKRPSRLLLNNFVDGENNLNTVEDKQTTTTKTRQRKVFPKKVIGRGSMTIRRPATSCEPQRPESEYSRVSNYSEDGTAATTSVMVQNQAWNCFVEYIQQINVTPTYQNTSTETDKKEKSKERDELMVKFKASDSFRKALTDIKKKKVWKSTRLNLKLMSSKLNVDGDNEHDEDSENTTKEEDEDSESDVEEKPKNSYAQRGWAIIRQHVKTLGLEKRQSSTAFSWNILRHQLKQMTNLDRARQDLYVRYGIMPAEGSKTAKSTMVVKMSEQSRAIIEKYKNLNRNAKGNRRYSTFGNHRTEIISR